MTSLIVNTHDITGREGTEQTKRTHRMQRKDYALTSLNNHRQYEKDKESANQFALSAVQYRAFTIAHASAGDLPCYHSGQCTLHMLMLTST